MKLLARNPNLRILEPTVPCAPDVPNLDALPSLNHLEELQVRCRYGRTGHRSSSFMKWLGTLTQLESLALWYVPMLNLLPLRELKNLRSLVISGDFRTIVPIDTLTSLEVLELHTSHQMDFTSLLALRNLRRLRLPEYIDCAPFDLIRISRALCTALEAVGAAWALSPCHACRDSTAVPNELVAGDIPPPGIV